MIAEAIRRVIEGKDLSRQEMYQLFGRVMDGEATDIQKSALLVALRMKGETAEEITGAAMAMRERVVPLVTNGLSVIDTCGTGGDGLGTFNISTVAAIVAAGAGVRVAKHGNRAVSSKCGSADVLSALGVNIDLDVAQMSRVLEEVGISFLFAPKLHPAMAAVVPVRRELGVRTIFNILGPLTNPAFARRQVLGVYSPSLVIVVAQVLKALGSEHALVVHSVDGMDEISISAPTRAVEVRNGELLTMELTPESLGLNRAPIEEIEGGDVARNAEIAREILGGAAGAARDVVLANAGAAIYVSGLAGSIIDGVSRARESIDSGAAVHVLAGLIEVSNAA
ncbi:MAG TPA: anthranilate phosphoribosyltransferase [Thermoanaerobaculia bacterium]|nr:anthranilate phosphoribosyltransferase [Thermoanaerobaculia bacterium]